MARRRAGGQPGGAVGRARVGRLAGALLLAVFLAGFGVTTFADGWLFAAPHHDHLFLGDRHLGHGFQPRDRSAPDGAGAHAHHAHNGDGLSRAFAALREVAPARDDAAVGSPAERGGVVSIWSPAGGLTDLGAFAFSLGVLVVAAVLLCLDGWRILAANAASLAGRRLAPPLPPPRAA